MRSLAGVLIALIVGVFLLLQALFIVDQREKVIVFRFGAISEIIEKPGLYFKIPFVDNYRRYNNRILTLETEEFEVTFSDNRRLIVDAFSRWRIADVRAYHLAVVNRSEAGARDDLARILENALRSVLGSVGTDAILSSEREVLMQDVKSRAEIEAEKMGVEIVDVRIVRSDLPNANLEATINRMIAERRKEAADEIARGNEAKTRIVANAERQATEITSQARKESEIIKGEADAERNGVFAEAYSADPEFFDFYRSLRAYRESFGLDSGDGTGAGSSTIILSPDNDFFRYLDAERGGQ